MTIFKVYDSIPLNFSRIKNGAAVTGLSVTVTVQNVVTGATLLASTALVEVSPGLYSYNWVTGISTQTECVTTFTTGGAVFKEVFTVDDTIKQLLSENGRST